MKYIFVFASILIASKVVSDKAYADDEISLYDNKGEAVAYIDVSDDLTIYLWSGKPVAYLDADKNVYGFNGKHLGWFVNGTIMDHRGDAPCVFKEVYPGNTSYERYKSYKQYKPLKLLPELDPLKPHRTRKLSSMLCSIFLAIGGN